MTHSTPKRCGRAALKLSTAMLMLSLVMAPGHAGVGDEMEDYFTDMGAAANVTGASSFEGQSAGYYTLGSAWTRFPQKTVYPANLQLPSVRAGCGGIDIFTGSFSFINASEFVAMLKAVANNAVGFAFKLAIDSISPQIGGVMNELQDIANKINSQNLSSCETAQALVGGIAGEIGIKRGMVCDAVGTSKGLFSDWARAAQKCGNDGQESSTLAQADGALKAQLPGPKNYAWDMINGSSLAGADTQMKEFVMTLTGTIIVGTRASDNEELRIDYVGHGDLTILDALLYGDSSVRIKKCQNTTDCLSLASADQTIPALGNKALMPKIAEMIRSMSLKIKTDQPLTAEERNLLGVSSVPIYKILAVQAASGFIVNNSEINVLAEITAIDVLNSIVQRLMDQIAAGQSNNLNASDMKNLEQFNAQVAQVRARLVQHEISVSNKVNQTFDIINNAIRIESTLQSRMAPGMAASLNFSRALSAQGLRP